MAILFFFFQAPAAAKPVKASLREKLLQMDPIGLVVLLAAIVCYILPLQWGGITKSWNDPSIVGTSVGFVLLLIVFVGVEMRMDDRAMLQGSLLGNRVILVNCLYIFL